MARQRSTSRRFSRRRTAGYTRYTRQWASRYRPSPRLNDSETRSMVFTATQNFSLVVPTAGVVTSAAPWSRLLANDDFGSVNTTFTPLDGRIWHAMCMYDSCRLMSFSVSIRPLQMPDSGATLSMYISWDRYGSSQDTSGANTIESIRDDPSSRMVTWSSGGDPYPLRHQITAIRSDWNNFINIDYNLATGDVVLPDSPEYTAYSPFHPVARIALQHSPGLPAQVTYPFVVQARARILFRGAAAGMLNSNTAPDYFSPIAFHAAAEPRTPSEPIQE